MPLEPRVKNNRKNIPEVFLRVRFRSSTEKENKKILFDQKINLEFARLTLSHRQSFFVRSKFQIEMIGCDRGSRRPSLPWRRAKKGRAKRLSLNHPRPTPLITEAASQCQSRKIIG